jgi:molybdopterin synthase catalytic subunit
MKKDKYSITILLFAGIREKIKKDTLFWTVSRGDAINDVIDKVAITFNVSRTLLESYMYAVNGEYVDFNKLLVDGDEIAVIPPVSGGSFDYSDNDFIRVKITEDKIDEKELLRFVKSEEDGAVLTFSGVTRNINNGKEVTKLEYQVYGPMAEKKMSEILNEARLKWDISRCFVVHRVGTVLVGETSMVLCLASKHRSEAFLAAQYFVERLKKIVPIWKKEFYLDGEEWIGETPQ